MLDKTKAERSSHGQPCNDRSNFVYTLIINTNMLFAVRAKLCTKT